MAVEISSVLTVRKTEKVVNRGEGTGRCAEKIANQSKNCDTRENSRINFKKNYVCGFVDRGKIENHEKSSTRSRKKIHNF